MISPATVASRPDAGEWDVSPDVPRPHRVVDRWESTERGDVVTLRVRPLDGDPPEFRPAQFSMIGVPGFGDVPISISSSVDDRTGHEFTIRRSGAITAELVDRRVGDVVSVRGPFGRPWSIDRLDGPMVFVAGGIGLAPLRAGILSAVDRVTDPADVSVLVGAKTPRDLVFREWLADLRGRGVDVDVIVDSATGADSVDSADTTGSLDEWEDRVGLVTELVGPHLERRGRSRPISVYVCGPDPMMTATVRRAVESGVPPERIELTLERNMKCGVGWCGHCQLGPLLLCRDGPVVGADRLGDLLEVAEL